MSQARKRFAPGETGRDFHWNKRGGSKFGNDSGSAGFARDITEAGEVSHTCEELLVCRCTLDKKVPYFNGRIFLENKQEIGKIDEILGPINQFFFSVRIDETLKAKSFQENTKLFISTSQVLPLARFLPNAVSLACAKKTKKPKQFGGRKAPGHLGPKKPGFSPRGGRGGYSSRGGQLGGRGGHPGGRGNRGKRYRGFNN